MWFNLLHTRKRINTFPLVFIFKIPAFSGAICVGNRMDEGELMKI